MPGIFINYRKEDTRAWAIHLRDHLEREFGPRWATATDATGHKVTTHILRR